MVSEPNEPSYYEVALTRRQVTVAFVVLLVCMVASFLAGVWVTRGAQAPGAVSTAVAAAPAAQTTDSQLPEYKFFTDRDSSAPKAPAAPSPAPTGPPAAAADPDTTLLADVGGDPVATAGGAADAGPETVDAGATDPELAPAPVAAPTAAAPAPTVYRDLQAGEMAVQVFSSADEQQARAILRQLKAAGYTVFLSPLATGNRQMFRVRVGPYTDRAAAERVADEVKQRFKLETWIAK